MLGLGTALSLAEEAGFRPDPGTPGPGGRGGGVWVDPTPGGLGIVWGPEEDGGDWSPGEGGDAAEDIWVPGVDYDVDPGVEKKEEPGAPAVTLTAPPGSLQAGQWFNPLARQEYTAPAAQDWSGWMFGSPFGEQGGLLYQPWSAEYGQQYVPSNIWNWNPMEMSKATAFAPPIASTSILGEPTSVENTTANNNNNTVVTTDPTEGMGGGTGPMAGDVPTHPLFGAGLTPAEIAILESSGYAIGDSLSSDMGEAGEPVGGAEEGQGFYE